jgi:hypothetical protein
MLFMKKIIFFTSWCNARACVLYKKKGRTERPGDKNFPSSCGQADMCPKKENHVILLLHQNDGLPQKKAALARDIIGYHVGDFVAKKS